MKMWWSFLLAALSISTCSSLKGVDVQNPIVNFTPSFLVRPSGGSKDTISCERIHISGKSRRNLQSYANAYRITFVPSVVIPERLHSKIQICLHKNASLGSCQCASDNWRSVQNGVWNSVMSPYEDRYLDVKFTGEVLGSVTVTVEEDFQQWRIVCLAVGFVLQLFAPIVSSWVPFYYSSSMAIGVFLVVIILLFQGMKLLPTSRKNFFYLSIYSSVFGAGSYLLHQFSIMITPILLNLGFSEEMHNPVSVLVALLIGLAGAALGYWLVRKFVISDDGTVDVGVAQFVKWAMRTVGFTCVFQSTLDTSLAWTAQGICLLICLAPACFKWKNLEHLSFYGNKSLREPTHGRATAKQTRAEFLSRPGTTNRRRNLLNSPNSPRSSAKWFDSPVKGLVSPSSTKTENEQEFYSTFHKTPNRKKFSKQEWEDFTEESTRQAVGDWASTPEFTDWNVKNADRVKVIPDESSDESLGSGSDSTDEAAVETSNNGFGLNKWQQRK